MSVLSERAAGNFAAVLASEAAGNHNACATIPAADCKLILAALERARVVGVLDGWAHPDTGRGFVWRLEYLDDANLWELSLKPTQGKRVSYTAATPDEARAKAVAAIEAGEV